MPRIDDRWVEDLLCVVQQSDLPASTRAKAAISLGPVLAAANAEAFDAGLAPVAETLFGRIRHVLYDIYTDPSAPSLLRRQALEAFAHAPGKRLEDAIRTAYAGDDDWRATALLHVPSRRIRTGDHRVAQQCVWSRASSGESV